MSLLTSQRMKSNVQEQLIELECLQSIFIQPNEFVLHDAAHVETLQRLLGTTTIASVEGPILDKRAIADLSLLSYTIYWQEFEAELQVVLPLTYPHLEPPQVSLFCSGMHFGTLEKMNEKIHVYLKENHRAEVMVFEVHQFVMEEMQVYYENRLEKMSEEAAMNSESDNEDDFIDDSFVMVVDKFMEIQDAIPVLGRRAIYFHHIISSAKRKVIVDWAVELQLGGFSKIGWPGVIIVEGSESHALEYVRRLQHLRWKQMVVRGEQIEQGQRGQSMNSLRKLPFEFREFPENGMADLAKSCREADLEELFLTTMKIYNKKSHQVSEAPKVEKNKKSR